MELFDIISELLLFLGIIFIAYLTLIVIANIRTSEPKQELYVPYIFAMDYYHSFKPRSYDREPVMITICKDECDNLLFAISYINTDKYQVGEIKDLKYENHFGGMFDDELEFEWECIGSDGLLEKKLIRFYRNKEKERIDFRCLTSTYTYTEQGHYPFMRDGYVGSQVYPNDIPKEKEAVHYIPIKGYHDTADA